MKKVLLIEDDFDIQNIYSQKLSFSGYKVSVASNASEGLDSLNSVRPDVILLDIMLPGKINGFDFLEQIKKDSNFKNIPVLVLTNIDSEKESAMKIGAVDYLIKANTDLNIILEKVKKYTS